MNRRDSIVAALLLALAVNSAYLAARADASLFYFANVALHVALGFACSATVSRLARRAWPSLDGLWRAAASLFAVGSLLGVVLLFTGATRPYRPVLYAHAALVGLAAVLALLAGARRALAFAVPAARAAAVAAAVLAAAAPVARVLADRYPPQHRIVNPALAPLAMEGEGQGPQGPFFPSSGETNVGGIVPSNFFMKSQDCARCHKDIYDQWNSSAHHFASFNNQWYRKSIEYMQDVVGTKPSKWCAGCHDHAVLFAGKFDRPIKEQIGTPESQAGLACTSCHSIVHVKSTMGQGDFTIEYPPLHDLAVSD
ncbi:MAG: multiheme c-type cytochrome, partial [Vicinamibacteria bacterium]